LILANRSKTDKGRDFEQHAANYLIGKGYEIIQTNWRGGRQEIDIVARKNGTVIFVEVKASLTDDFGHPVERVDRKKRDNLIKAALQYIETNSLGDAGFRFDVITFHRGKLEHFPDAFQVDA
jgi:putative endonuclease